MQPGPEVQMSTETLNKLVASFVLVTYACTITKQRFSDQVLFSAVPQSPQKTCGAIKIKKKEKRKKDQSDVHIEFFVFVCNLVSSEFCCGFVWVGVFFV